MSAGPQKDLKTAIRLKALELGADDCRFTTAAPPASGPAFARWLAEGRHGEMSYLGRNAAKRLNPGLVLEGARSVIAVAVSYYPGPARGQEARPDGDQARGFAVPDAAPRSTQPAPIANPSPNRPAGLVATYARYADYHRVMGVRLRDLADFVTSRGGAATRALWYVDTGPLLERDLAARAGLGFIGKHTNLISRSLGNWLFLGHILTTLEVAPDEPERNRCGSCTRCLAACPTQAIRAPFQLDARRCISYLTIELKGPIPPELRASVGHRVFGCDDCLEVCPWNRFARAGRLMQSHLRADLAAPDLLALLDLGEADFRQRFNGTPLERAKHRGLRRNVCVALGNVGDSSCLPALERAALQADPLVAEHARWAIGQIRARSATG